MHINDLKIGYQNTTKGIIKVAEEILRNKKFRKSSIKRKEVRSYLLGAMFTLRGIANSSNISDIARNKLFKEIEAINFDKIFKETGKVE
ncbi:MAG: hypothetical protein JSV62_04395 [Promethearchaeota archaeon]|nr:MAG: hypothetical protein JSV62_04395 [Candidatus Lokiarchaeota archaeon]